MSVADKYFKDAVNKILTEGVSDEAFEVRPKWPDGTPAHTRKIHCYVARYNLAEEFPILTLRTQAFKSCVKEILWMWQKKSNVVSELGAHFWDAWELEDGTFKEGKKFLHVSTDEVYGSLPDDDNAFFYETSPYEPHSPYSASKASSDMLVKAYMDTYHFPANITNCSNNYGPYQFPEKLIPLIINNALQGKKLPVYGDGKNVRDWLYVMDHAKAIDMVQEQGKLFETYNVGGHNEKQNIEIINIILETLQEMLPDSDPRKAHINKDLITYVEDRKGHDRRYAIAPDKIKEHLGWYPETMFKDGIKLTIQWFFEHEDWMKNVTSGDYQKYYEDMYKNK